ncbi:MAG: hypothetical protein G01um101433_1031 [Parcubacteria group bacterium Gr01-1014_33]|nr:MAG: hypothetical protein G01um101433_1031 [Parcubacteria group bacterium Gr01-1014_33]
MIVSSASVKIHEDFSFLQRLQKSLKVEFLQHRYFGVVVKFFLFFPDNMPVYVVLFISFQNIGAKLH